MIHAAVDEGVRLFDTADCYGAGHSERVIGRALAALPRDVRDEITVATKFGLVFDEATRSASGQDLSPAAIRRACRASLRRLGVESIDLYQMHPGGTTADEARAVVAVLDGLVAEGLGREVGTSADDPVCPWACADSPHARTVQSQVNVFGRHDEVLSAAEAHGFAVLARSPLAMGLLTGKYDAANRPPVDDVRRDTPYWTYFDDGAMEDWLARLT